MLALGHMVAFFHRMAPAVLAVPLMHGFHTSAVALGMLSAIYYYVYTAMQIPSGILADTLGPRINVAIFSAIAGVGSIVFALAPNFAVASVGRFLVGLGVSTAFIGLMKHNASWFSERQYASVSGFVLLVGNLGSVLAAGPLAALLTQVSWRAVFVVMGIFSLVHAAAIAILVRDTPEDAGFPSPHEIAGLSATTQYSQPHWFESLRQVAANPLIWPYVFFAFGIFGNFLAFSGLWAVPQLQARQGLSATAAANCVTFALVGSALTSTFAGWYSDRIGKRRPVMLASAVLFALCWMLLLAAPGSGSWPIYAVFALFGFSTGGMVAAYAACKEVSPPQASGMALALVNTALFLGAALLQPLFGWVMELTWDGTVVEGVRQYTWTDYRNGVWLSLGVSLLGILGAALSRETFNRNITRAGTVDK